MNERMNERMEEGMNKWSMNRKEDREDKGGEGSCRALGLKDPAASYCCLKC